jgi:hypothetical protein
MCEFQVSSCRFQVQRAADNLKLETCNLKLLLAVADLGAHAALLAADLPATGTAASTHKRIS